MRTSASSLSLPERGDPHPGEAPEWGNDHRSRGAKELTCGTGSLTHPVPAHRHDCYLIVFTFAGSGQHEHTNGCFPILPGDVWIIPPGCWHAYPRVDGSLSLFSVRITCDYVAACAALLSEIRCIGPLLCNTSAPRLEMDDLPRASHIRLSGPALDRVRPLLLALAAELQTRPASGREALCAGLLLQILGWLERCGECHLSCSREEARQDDTSVLSAIQYLEEHCAEPLTIREVAYHSGYTPTYLTRKFRQHLGMSPSTYLLQLRLQHACALLQSTNLPVASIAREAGFRDSHYFATRFHQVMGTTPSAFRARSRIDL